jgi:hypothetical protein
MTLQQFLSTDLANRLGWALAHSVWEGVLIAGALRLVLSVLRRRSPQARYLASTGAMALMLVGGALAFGLAAPPPPSVSLGSATASIQTVPAELRASVVNLQRSLPHLAAGDALLFPNQFVNVRLHLEPQRAGAPATQPDARFVARLQFRLVAEPGDKAEADAMAGGGRYIRALKTVELDERDVARAYSTRLQGGEQAIGVDFTDDGAKKFERLTAANIHRRLAIVFDGRLLSAPMIQTRISGSAVITPGSDGFKSVAATQPTTAPATQPAGVGQSPVQGRTAELPHQTLASLSRDYALQDGQVMQIIRPPFPDARALAIQQSFGVTAEDGSKVRCVCFNWKDGIAVPGAWYKQDAQLESLYGLFIDTPWTGFDSDSLSAFKWPGLHGDVIVRNDATPGDRLKAFMSMIGQETKTPAEAIHRKMARTCVVLHGDARLHRYDFSGPNAVPGQESRVWLNNERGRVISEISGYESRRDSLNRDLDAGRMPPDIEQRIRDTSTYTQFRNQVISLDIELKRLRQFRGPSYPQVVEIERIKAALQAKVDEEHEELKSAIGKEMEVALESQVRDSKTTLERVEERTRELDGERDSSEQRRGIGERRGFYAVFITATPLDDSRLDRWTSGVRDHGIMGRPDGVGIFNLEGVGYQLGAPLIIDRENTQQLEANVFQSLICDNGQASMPTIFLVADDVAGWRSGDPGYAVKLTHVVDNLKKQTGGDWRIEQRDFDVLSLRLAAAK